MKRSTQLKYKIAAEKAEFDQLHRLNYQTFVEEIPQHDVNPNRRLIDRFNEQNTYIVCLRNSQLVGMVAVRRQRPFSLDQKLGNLDSYLPPGRTVCEIRLLAVKVGFRNGLVFRGLVKFTANHCKQQGYDFAVISGVLNQEKLYRALGFVPFGPIVGNGTARFQPMYLSLENFEKHGHPLLAASKASRRKTILLPGPVAVKPAVWRAFIQAPVSHRSEDFVREVQRTKELLCKLVGCRKVEILVGSGTLANDVIAGQLSLRSERGLVLSNGEFGGRLIDHARRFGLSFDVCECEWGERFDWETIRYRLDRAPDIRWLWAVHCETSTGMLNELVRLKELSSAYGVLLCLDCMCSIGTVPLDLSGVYLASGVSGKGLGALPGLSMVFYDHHVPPEPTALPRYLDLGLYAAESGVPFTASSNLLYALKAALLEFKSEKPFGQIFELSRWLRSRLREFGFAIVTPDAQTSPAVITMRLPQEISSAELGELLERQGFLLSYKSRYLLERNWLQICLMGECSREEMTALLNAMQRFSHGRNPSNNLLRTQHLSGVSS
ncbi:MAG TPA: aminotransferase class V-fold PLP-dependent enzyme [Candidatus Binatia bacterium]|nr:aminotransferase class V-fold PLP-dependent enzyme [Candidatus Binatia bacterium]